MSSATAAIEAVFGLVDREIWIVTAAANQQRGGLTATWVSQASIDAARPIALIGLAPNHFTAELVEASGAFALHLLAADQANVAWNFARDSGRHRDKFADLKVSTGVTGSPRIDPCLASLECSVFARLATGDRTYYWADIVEGVVSLDAGNDSGGPLTERQFIQSISDEQRKQLRVGRDRDISVQRPLLESWRQQIPEMLRCP